MDNAAENFEGARAVKFGVFTLLDLQGTWREMGRQYGALASENLKRMYARAVEDMLISGQGRNRENLDEIAGGFYANFPYRLKEVLRGISETSGLDFDRVLLLNAVEVIVAGELWSPRCSGIAVWG